MTDSAYGIPFNNQLSAVFVAEGYLSDEECEAALLLCRSQEQIPGSTYTQESDETRAPRSSTIAWLPHGDESDGLFRRLQELALFYNKGQYKFQIQGFLEGLQYARYNEGDFFDWHSDLTQDIGSLRKLSLSVQLSHEDQYEGGNLEFKYPLKQNARKRGSVIIFPAFTPHRVTEVTGGQREALVAWVHGMPFS